MEAKLEWLDDPRVFRVGKLPAHSDHEIYRDKADYKAGNQADTLSLDGEWNFHYGASPRERTEQFYDPQAVATRAEFNKISVPGHIQLQGYGQIQYINTLYPWDGQQYRRPPFMDGDTQGCRAFSVPHRIIRLANMLRSLIYQRILKISGCISHLTVWNRRCICG